ncbi:MULTISPECIES: acyl carrier protein [unclassified Streptomyces]|uniref:acyl carrier protein n=1 Tax=unclassified Streptomyces TaxID=2593676 RepID=UPI00381F7ADF
MTDLDRTKILSKLNDYVVAELLDGKDAEQFDTTTPLLDWGLLNSIETARLVSFVRQELGVRVPPADMVKKNFQDLESIADLLLSLQDSSA